MIVCNGFGLDMFGKQKRGARFMIRFLLIFLIAAAQSALADPLPVSDQASQSLNGAVSYLEDPEGRYTIEFIRKEDLKWQSQGDSAFNKGYSASVWWLKLSLANPSNQSINRYLELSYAVLDYVDLYVYSNDNLLNHYELGDMHPFAQRPIENRFFVVPLQWKTGQTIEIIYRIKTSTAVQAPLTLWQRNAFEQKENKSNIAQGFYYGAMIVITVYNLMIFMVLWERSYLFYVLFVSSLPLFMAAISGQAYRFLWPNSVVWNDHSLPFFLGLAFASSALFAQRFLQVKKWSSWINIGLTIISTSALGCVVLSFVVPYHVSIHLLVPLGLFACLFEIIVGGMAWLNRIPSARYYVIAWLMFLFGGVMLALNKLNLLPTNFFTEYSMQFGSALEAILLSFALAERINVERKLRFAAQDEALRITRRLNEELEQRVQERTKELEVLNSKLQELSNTDQLTQLKNRRHMDEIMTKEWSRCKRYGHFLSIMMLDVDFFKKVNDQYGHPAGDACLKEMSKRMLTCVRWPSDQVARYGGEEFCIILPETDGKSALLVAERIREKVASQPINAEDAQFSVTISIGIESVIPSDENTLEAVLQHADLALYQSKQNGRNRVTLFDKKEGPNHAAHPMPASD